MKLMSNYNDTEALIVQDAARYNERVLRESLEMFRQQQFCAAESELHLAADSSPGKKKPVFAIRPHQSRKSSPGLEESGIKEISVETPSKFRSIIYRIRKFLHI